MKNTAREKLIYYFSEHNGSSLDEAKGSGQEDLLKIFNVKEWKDLILNEDYEFFLEPVRTMRKKLDLAIKNCFSAEQVEPCLRLIRAETEETNNVANIDILLKLINNKEATKCLYKSWNEKQRLKYDKACKIIVEWKHLFFSYCNRNIPKVNNDFKRFIEPILGKPVFRKEVNNKNLLAKTIEKLIDNENICFYASCGNETKENTLERLTKSYAFVQLIEKLVFASPKQNKENGCYVHYKEFANCETNTPRSLKAFKRRFFILTGPKSFPAKTPPKFKNWQNYAKRNEEFYLDPRDRKKTKYDLEDAISSLSEKVEILKDQIVYHYIEESI